MKKPEDIDGQFIDIGDRIAIVFAKGNASIGELISFSKKGNPKIQAKYGPVSSTGGQKIIKLFNQKKDDE